MFRYESDPSVGDWLRPRLGPFGAVVGSLVPQGYEAYARVLHPMYDEAYAPVTWASVAAVTGRVVHPTAQSVAGGGTARRPRTPGEAAREPRGRGGRVAWRRAGRGVRGRSGCRAIARVLARHTGSDLVAAFWEGTSWTGGAVVWLWSGPAGEVPPSMSAPDDLDPEVLDGPKLDLPHRAYVLFRAGPDDLVDLADGRARADVDPFRPAGRTPNLLWPVDEAWCLATEVDLDSTVVGGTRALVDDLLAAPGLEVVEVTETDALGSSDDLVNGS